MHSNQISNICVPTYRLARRLVVCWCIVDEHTSHPYHGMRWCGILRAICLPLLIGGEGAVYPEYNMLLLYIVHTHIYTYICTPDGPDVSKIWVPRFAHAWVGCNASEPGSPGGCRFLPKLSNFGATCLSPLRASYALVGTESSCLAPRFEASLKRREKEKRWSSLRGRLETKPTYG